MGRIYGLAKTVIVFLGAPSSTNSSLLDTLFQFLTNVGSALEDKPRMPQTSGQYQEHNRPVPDEVCKCLVELFLLLWWGRIWRLVSASESIDAVIPFAYELPTARVLPCRR
jgi:hypothetical protein